jgi:REP element-mobilizing transposase RayT
MGRGLHYNIRKDKTYFMTMTIVDWIDLFTRVNHKNLIVELLKHCQLKNGLNIFGWVLMPSHLHLMANAEIPNELSDIVRDFKKFKSKKLIDQIAYEPESRREWLLERFKFSAKTHSKTKDFKVWQDKNHPIELYTEKVTWQKLNYIHRNPVVDRIVQNEQDYLYSSARNYYNLPSLLDVHCLTPPVITVSSPGFFRV